MVTPGRPIAASTAFQSVAGAAANESAARNASKVFMFRPAVRECFKYASDTRPRNRGARDGYHMCPMSSRRFAVGLSIALCAAQVSLAQAPERVRPNDNRARAGVQGGNAFAVRME